MQESELIKRAQNGDKTAFEGLYRIHSGRIYALCLRLSGDVSLAEDYTQEAFLKVWQNLESYRCDALFSSWMFRITTNVVLGFMRKENKWQKVEFAEMHESHVELPESRDLEIGLLSLPVQARTVLILHEYLGYRHREIGQLTGLAIGTCKAHLHRAKKLLKERLRE